MTLDELIEKEKRLTFDSTDPGHHRELLKALTELKNIKEHEEKINEEIEEILQTCDQ
jgi:antitoxin component of RelBE/YafQ-DinJ toxin-antitoxin module